MLYKILNRKNECYDNAALDKLEHLYQGGNAILEDVRSFIPMKEAESQPAYKNRISNASYINYMAEIVDYYAANLFSKPFSVMPEGTTSDSDFYSVFAADADLAGNSFASVMKRALTDTLVYGIALIGIDFPLLEELPSTLKEEEEMQADRAYLYSIEPEAMINWEWDSFGKLKWCVLKKELKIQSGPFDSEDLITRQFKVWEIVNGFAAWKLFEIKTKPDQKPKDNDEVQLVAEGKTSFREIPIIKLSVETGLHIGNKIGNLCADHFRLRTSLLAAQDRSLYAVPYYKQGAEFNVDSQSAISENPHRGSSMNAQWVNRGFVVIGPTDELGYMEPSGAAYEQCAKQLGELADEIHRVVHQMANSVKSTSTALGRSGESKSQDNAATEIILQEYGTSVKECAKQIYNAISEARNEDIKWTTAGLSNYELVDKDLLTKEAMAVQNTINIPSPTFQKAYAMRLVNLLLPSINPETNLLIQEELESNFIMAHPAADKQEDRELNKKVIEQDTKKE